jgi:hypothetical protein
MKVNWTAKQEKVILHCHSFVRCILSLTPPLSRGERESLLKVVADIEKQKPPGISRSPLPPGEG